MSTPIQAYEVTVRDGRQQLVVSERFVRLEEALRYAQRFAVPGHTVRLAHVAARRRPHHCRTPPS